MNYRSAIFGTGLLVFAAAAMVLAVEADYAPLQVAGPLLTTPCVLWWLRLVYLWQRKASFKRRERRRKEHPAEKFGIPAGLKKPEQYDGGATLHEAQWIYIGRAVEAQGSYFAAGILAAILPPLALFLLSFQLLALPAGGNWAIGLILSEVLCLGILVYFALTNREPTSEWIENRTRTELLRREQYLFLAGVGPYLAKDDSEAAREALRRRGQIEGANARMLLGLVPLQERSGLTWLEALHHRGAGRLASRSDCIERMESYVYYRIGKQLLWFANELRDCEENERLWSRLLTGALLAAIAVAAVHAVHLCEAPAGDETVQGMRVLIGALGIVLPPLGTAFLSIRAMYNFESRSRIYGHEKGLLHAHKGALEALIQEANGVRAGLQGRDLDKIDFDFRAVALRTEHSLSVEMEQWMLLMERREHEVSP